MDQRIGSLHVRYRVRGGSIDAALTPGFDRAIQSGFAEAVAARFDAMLGNDPSVIVVRELKTSVAFNGRDAMLDSGVVELMCASSVDALGMLLSRDPSSDSLVRFADEAEFVGAFIVDVAEGGAWEHWYYGAFHRYRRADARETILAVLADPGADVARVLGWLSRHGKMDVVLALIGAREAMALFDARRSRDASEAYAGMEILAQAAWTLLTALGCDDVHRPRAGTIARFLATRPASPRWTDRRALTAWVLALIRFALAAGEDNPLRNANALPDAVRDVLAGSLDWLDGEWLAEELSRTLARGAMETPAVERAADRDLLTARQGEVLATIAARLREGTLLIPARAGATEICIRLVAAACEALPSGKGLDDTLARAIEENAFAAASAIPLATGIDGLPRSESDAAHEAASTHDGRSRSPSQALRRFGSAAGELLLALGATQAAASEPPHLTLYGGLFLLLRALIDTRLPALAKKAELPLAPILGAIAVKMFDIRTPFDAVTSVWVGADSPDYAELDCTSASVQAVADELQGVLVAQRVLDEGDADRIVEADAGRFDTILPCSRATDAAISRIASLLLHAWSHWLRGVAHSSASFLIDNCLRRAARARISDVDIAIELDPAPLDAVLEMAGCFDRIDAVPWLGGLSVTFTVRRAS